MQKVYKGWWPDLPWKQVQSLITTTGCPIQGGHLTITETYQCISHSKVKEFFFG